MVSRRAGSNVAGVGTQACQRVCIESPSRVRTGRQRGFVDEFGRGFDPIVRGQVSDPDTSSGGTR